MEHLIIHNAPESRFELDKHPEAFVVYDLQGNRIILTGTKVPKELEGQGIAAALVKTALDFAQANGYEIEATCSYVVAYLKRHSEYLAK